MKLRAAGLSLLLIMNLAPLTAQAVVFTAPEGTSTQEFEVTKGQGISECGGGLAIITCGIPGCDFETGKLEPNCVPQFILHVIRILFALAGVLSVIMIMVGGYMYATSQFIGSSPDEAIKVIQNAVLGVLLAIFSFMIISFVISAISP